MKVIFTSSESSAFLFHAELKIFTTYTLTDISNFLTCQRDKQESKQRTTLPIAGELTDHVSAVRRPLTNTDCKRQYMSFKSYTCRLNHYKNATSLGFCQLLILSAWPDLIRNSPQQIWKLNFYLAYWTRHSPPTSCIIRKMKSAHTGNKKKWDPYSHFFLLHQDCNSPPFLPLPHRFIYFKNQEPTQDVFLTDLKASQPAFLISRDSHSRQCGDVLMWTATHWCFILTDLLTQPPRVLEGMKGRDWTRPPATRKEGQETNIDSSGIKWLGYKWKWKVSHII